jgi:hypothetical protein
MYIPCISSSSSSSSISTQKRNLFIHLCIIYGFILIQIRAVWTKHTVDILSTDISAIFQTRFIDRYSNDYSGRFSGNNSFDIMNGVSVNIGLLLLINLGFLPVLSADITRNVKVHQESSRR